MGWIRAMKGHQPLDAEVKFKDGDGPFGASMPKPPTSS
jgi:topoisomerase-4 subunit A